jgi:hypothetical protein
MEVSLFDAFPREIVAEIFTFLTVEELTRFALFALAPDLTRHLSCCTVACAKMRLPTSKAQNANSWNSFFFLFFSFFSFCPFIFAARDLPADFL